MRIVLGLLLLLLSACRQGDPAPATVQARTADGPCRQIWFEDSRFTVCSARGARIEIRTSGADGRPYRTFVALESALGKQAERVAFAMNGGMFDESGDAIGLLIEDRREFHPLNLRKGGGNFHLLPNGVFLVRRDGTAGVVASTAFRNSGDIAFATQSGPMLVIDGKLHPAFEADGRSRFVRNGVGIAPDGTPLFVISDDLVSFGKLARFFRDKLGARNALYLDGSVSSLWDPGNGRRDSFSPLGPLLVVLKPGA